MNEISVDILLPDHFDLHEPYYSVKVALGPIYNQEFLTHFDVVQARTIRYGVESAVRLKGEQVESWTMRVDARDVDDISFSTCNFRKKLPSPLGAYSTIQLMVGAFLWEISGPSVGAVRIPFDVGFDLLRTF